MATGARIPVAAESSRAEGSDSKRGTQVLGDPLLISHRPGLELKRRRVFEHGQGLAHFVHGRSPPSKESIAARSEGKRGISRIRDTISRASALTPREKFVLSLP